MRALAAADARLALARRVITRSSDAGGEDFEGVSLEEFDRRVSAGGFALFWDAHGLRYGIPAKVDETLSAGQDVLANLSRSVLHKAQRRFAQTKTILLTASPQILAERLAARGRETGAEIEKRLKRASFELPTDIPTHVIDNSGALESTVQKALEFLYPVSVAR